MWYKQQYPGPTGDSRSTSVMGNVTLSASLAAMSTAVASLSPKPTRRPSRKDGTDEGTAAAAAALGGEDTLAAMASHMQGHLMDEKETDMGIDAEERARVQAALRKRALDYVQVGGDGEMGRTMGVIRDLR